MFGIINLPSRSTGTVSSVSSSKKRYAPIVNELLQLLDKSFPYASGMEALEQAIQSALQYRIVEMESYGLTSAKGFLNFATWMVDGWIPTESAKGRDIYYILCIFYFVFDQVPLKDCQTAIRPESVGQSLSELSQWMVKFAKEVGSHMNRPESLNEASLTSFWNAPSFHVFEADESKTEGGRWTNFNQFFCRHLKDGARPIDGEGDDNIVIFPADSTFSGYWDITDESMVELKGLPWHIGDLLGPYKSDYGDSFKGGIWLHSFLNSFDYHRQHAPVGGTIKVIDTIDGAAYLDVEYQPDSRSLMPKRPMRPIYSSGPVYRGAEATDKEGYQFLQARGIIIIENDKIGTVAVLPIGMAQVSSVVVRDDLKPGATINKGDEISHFEFGGSDIVVMFQGGKIDPHTLPQPLSRKSEEPLYEHHNYGEMLAKAKPNYCEDSAHWWKFLASSSRRVEERLGGLLVMPPQTRAIQHSESVGEKKRKPVRRDPEKRRQQNIQAQRRYREKLRERLGRLEALAESAGQTSAIESTPASGIQPSGAITAPGLPIASSTIVSKTLPLYDASDVSIPCTSGATLSNCQELIPISGGSPPTLYTSDATTTPYLYSDESPSTLSVWDPPSCVDPSLLVRDKPSDSLELYWTTTIDCGCTSPHFRIQTDGPDLLGRNEVRVFRFGANTTTADPYTNSLRIDRVCTIAAILDLVRHLGITEEGLCADQSPSPFFRPSAVMADDTARSNLIRTVQETFKTLKPDLRPSQEQITIEHHPIIDILPFRTLRRNLITRQHDIDEDEFFEDMLSGLVCWGGAGIGKRDRQVSTGYASTGTPWDVRSWEGKVWFLKKYWALLGGEDGELVRQSEWWRSIRGDESEQENM
ncbi:hypothetical protein ASPFODRAFT_166048 [Aspergillus luchuensis CBS 106.47]|uniref:BZIP domain-containing protein n=1 Tax=Aspergillus luchuensis (strain CBS 106.47) TaxID=1137211 RepID=A0A1M3TC65_ASPLC|nr:hypothetical protein ASPFODRAFT_166048 [Aspergillus luchuensis CBS 106.47]